MKTHDTGEQDLSRAALPAFFRMAAKWELSETEERALLGSPAQPEFQRWKRDNAGELPEDALMRISYLLGIYKALHTIFPDSKQADGWIRRPNAAPLFGGRSALDLMLAGQIDGLSRVRRYLDAERD